MGRPKQVTLEEGSRVEGNYRGRGKWYPGKITRDRYDGTYCLLYKSGDADARAGKANVRRRQIARDRI